MKRNIGYYIFIVIEFFLISCLIYQLAIKGTYIYYKGVTAFILLELLEIFMFYKLNKNINNFKLNFYFHLISAMHIYYPNPLLNSFKTI